MERAEPIGKVERVIRARLEKPLTADKQLGEEPELSELLASQYALIMALVECVDDLASEIDRLGRDIEDINLPDD